jgi:hypothetical protein
MLYKLLGWLFCLLVLVIANIALRRKERANGGDVEHHW